jgi:hypothetical protein
MKKTALLLSVLLLVLAAPARAEIEISRDTAT